MGRLLLSILKFETRVTPGTHFHLKTDWFAIDEEVQTIIIDQSNVRSKVLSIYPEGFFMYLEQNPAGTVYRTNYPLYLSEGQDYYEVDWDLESARK